MNTKVLILSGLILVLFSSCKDYLDPYPSGVRTSEDIWKYQDNVQGLVGRCYDYMARNYNDAEGAYLDGATDNAELTSSTNALHRLATGSITTGQDPFLGYWNRDYQSINLVNLFLKDRRGYNTRFLLDKHLNDLVRRRLQGEAFALRAWFQWDLLQKFGGKDLTDKCLVFLSLHHLLILRAKLILHEILTMNVLSRLLPIAIQLTNIFHLRTATF